MAARATSRLSPFERGCLLVVALAALLRVTFVLEPGFIWDSAWYLMLARSFGETGTFLLRWSTPEAPLYSGYWPPLFPVFASPFVAVFGESYRTLVLASVTASALLTLAVFLTTRDLLGRRPAFAAMALVAATPAFYVGDANGMSESLLALMIVLAVWAFVKSLERPAYLPLAGAFAFLAYLGKASLGLPIVGALVAALVAWRVYTRGWRRVVRSPMDVGLAAAALVGIVVLAATRTERIGGIGVGVIDPVKRALVGAECSRLVPFLDSTGVHCWAGVFVFKVAFVAAFLLVVTLPFSLRLRDALRATRTERTDALWLAVLLPLLAGAVFTTSFFFTERRELVDFDNIRYLTPAIVPFAWVLLAHYPLPEEPRGLANERVRRSHLAWYWGAVAAMVALLLLNPLAGTETLPRFAALLLLSLAPIAVAAVAFSTNYGVAERRVGRDVERRFVRTGVPGGDAKVALAATLVLVVAASAFSSWYAAVGLGLVVAIATASPARRAIAMGLVLLASAAPTVDTPLPAEEAAAALAKLPEGTLVGMSEIIVYPAAVAPDTVAVRLVEPASIPDDAQALLMSGAALHREYEGFTRVAQWDYGFRFSPTLAARLAIERSVLGETFEFQKAPGLALYVRNGTGLERAFA